MKYTIDDETLHDTDILSSLEVAEQLLNCDAFKLEPDEKMGEVYLDGGLLVIDIIYDEPMDVRIDGCMKRNETFDMGDIREYFTAADYYAWAKDEDGDDVLMCFGCC